jgi:hypothetical protein
MTVLVSWYILRRSFFATHRGPWLLLRSSHLILPVISTHFQRQASFSSMPDTMKGWGLSSSNMTFFRDEMRALLFRYINQGDAMIEYEWLAVYYDDFFLFWNLNEHLLQGLYHGGLFIAKNGCLPQGGSGASGYFSIWGSVLICWTVKS